jgi:thiol-disulfide isomerase/thioredoxin
LFGNQRAASMFEMMRRMAEISSPPLLVACLCAQWCGSCREYRSTFDEVAASFPTAHFLWVDIEDESDLVDPIEVENFPTLMIVQGERPRFLGPLMPHKETLVRLVRAQLEDAGGADLTDPAVQALAVRLRHFEG